MATTREIMADLERFVEREVAGVASDVVRELSEATPKDTGWAAASWKSSIGGPLRDPIVPAGSVGQAKAEQQKRLVNLLLYKVQFGSVHVSNSSGYVSELDAERPFVAKAIDRAVTGRQAVVIRRR